MKFDIVYRSGNALSGISAESLPPSIVVDVNSVSNIASNILTCCLSLLASLFVRLMQKLDYQHAVNFS